MPRPDEICPRIDRPPPSSTIPAAPAITPTTVWACESPTQAEAILAGENEGFVYQRVGHPNAVMFADKAKELHAAENAVVTASGMAAMSVVMLAQLRAGSKIVASNQLYGQTADLLGAEATRFGITCVEADLYDLGEAKRVITADTDLVVVETIANPLLRVADIAALAELAHRANAKLVVDNTFATPIVCQPLTLGADFVVESVSKMMNGHSDAMIGLVLANSADTDRLARVNATWGFASSPFDCFLATRGLTTLHLRCQRSCENALRVANFLREHSAVSRVIYPGLKDHSEHSLAVKQFGEYFGSMVTFDLPGGRSAVDTFIANCAPIRFCPSLGEAPTTISHPATTSHRTLSAQQRESLGVTEGTLRLSTGIESMDGIKIAMENGLAATMRC